MAADRSWPWTNVHEPSATSATKATADASPEPTTIHAPSRINAGSDIGAPSWSSPPTLHELVAGVRYRQSRQTPNTSAVWLRTANPRLRATALIHDSTCAASTS